MKPEVKDTWKKALLKEIRTKLHQIFDKKKKGSLWKNFIQKGAPGAGSSSQQTNLEKIIREAYPNEFEEFLNSGEMQITIMLARLKALEKAVFDRQPELKVQFLCLQEEITEEVIAREWFSYKSGRMSSSDFYDFLENTD